MEVNINYWAVLVAAIASMAIGFIWYGVLFRQQWMSLMGYTSESMKDMKMSANKAYLVQFILSLVMAYVLAHSLIFGNAYLDMSGWMAGVKAGFWNWLGFVLPVTMGVVLWENKSCTLWAINAFHYLASLVVMGIILSLWV